MPNPDGSVTRPQNGGQPQGKGAPQNKSPLQNDSHTKGGPILPGVKPDLVKTTGNVLNANGFIGVMPEYQNFANETESPAPVEPEGE